MNRVKTLVVLAAGIGSRYGGIKQIDKFGPTGETIIDYTLFNAKKIGFNKVVFIVKKSILKEFESIFTPKFQNSTIQVKYALQELDSQLGNFPFNPEREKPWGTGHAILVTKDIIQEPFVVVNADDFYGNNGLSLAFDFMLNHCSEKNYGLVGYNLLTTLSEHGTVNRGICKTDQHGNLMAIKEQVNIALKNNTAVTYENDKEITLDLNALASMNLWIFHHSVFHYLEKYFQAFLQSKGQELKSEYFLPDVIDLFIKHEGGKVKVIPNHKDRWFGVTYKEDAPFVRNEIKKLVDSGEYPSPLF